ncbi:MAG: TerC family protein [Verrucomicrobia bacterium]|nr:MAG: TerC family protein [Verrucomicrobiota bacterium]
MEIYGVPLWAWAGFAVFIATMLALDLGVFHRESKPVGLREALVWCGVWVSLALGFNALVYFWYGHEHGMEFLAGYVVELSLSVDNVFVFILIFSYFKVPPAYHHRVLFWGILGAVLMRLIFILGGIALLERFHWVIYAFGAFLVYTGIRMALPRKEEFHPENNPVLKLFRRLFPVTEGFEQHHFFVRRAGRLMATPLAVVLVVVESTDIVFAVDSIPAILAITKNPFIVLTSNIFAILGLRSFYFALSGVMGLFRFLSYGLAVVLAFIGVKMLISGYVHVPIEISLGVIWTVLTVSVILSLLFPARERA